MESNGVTPEPHGPHDLHDVAVVAIGRNEGERLRACIASALQQGTRVVYVDSGSTDDSVATARALGAEVVALDMSVPFTAARGRNAGEVYVRERHPEVAFIQFVDGDCQIVDGWLARARAVFDEDPKIAGVWGRRRERYPDATVYNRICDIDWTFFVRPGKRIRWAATRCSARRRCARWTGTTPPGSRGKSATCRFACTGRVGG
jgi:glycosyltransferase involved in cell wall biosynthesis